MDTSPQTSLAERHEASEGWFDSLPEEHRQRILAEDEAGLTRWEQLERSGRGAWKRPALHAGILLVSTAAFITACSPAAILASVVTGALTGWLWQVTGAGMLRSPLIAVPLFLLGLLVTGTANVFAFIWAPLPISVVSVWLGLRRGELPGA